MDDDDANRLERRRFPNIAVGLTLLVIGLLLVLALARCTPPINAPMISKSPASGVE